MYIKHSGTTSLLSRNQDTLRAASLILFDENPTPQAVIAELESTWLPAETKIRYQAA